MTKKVANTFTEGPSHPTQEAFPTKRHLAPARLQGRVQRPAPPVARVADAVALQRRAMARLQAPRPSLDGSVLLRQPLSRKDYSSQARAVTAGTPPGAVDLVLHSDRQRRLFAFQTPTALV
jgi:hypothetical protein